MLSTKRLGMAVFAAAVSLLAAQCAGGQGITATTPGGGGGGGAFSSLTSGTNTTAAMQVGTGATLAPTGSGVVNANQINGAAVPASTVVLGSNSSGQIVSGQSGISAALSTGNGMQIGGDSICEGTGTATPFTNAFAFLLRPVIGGYWNQTCRPGDQLIDTTSAYTNTFIEPGADGRYPVTMVEDGTNDVTNYGTSANLQTTWQAMYAADVYNAGLAYSVKAYPGFSLTGWTPTGAWANDTTQGSLAPDYVSTTNGNTLAYAATCTASCVGVLFYPIWNANGGTFTVSLDGTPITVPYGGGGTTFYAAGFNGATITAASSTAATYTKSAVRIPMASGSHTITVTVTSGTAGGNKVGVNAFAIVPVASTSNPNVEAISLQHQNNANDSLSGIYTGYIQAIVSQAVADGVNAYYADVRDAMLNTAVPINLYYGSTGATSLAVPSWVAGGANTVSYAATRQPLTLVSSSPSQGQYTFSAGTYGLNVADVGTPLSFSYNANCGSTESAMFAACYQDALHPNNTGHAIYASVIAAALPAALVTGNNVPQATNPYRTYTATAQFPSQMSSPNPYNLSSGNGFTPGFTYACYNYFCYFTSLTSGGITEIFPNNGSAAGYSVASYTTNKSQPTNGSQLSYLLTMAGSPAQGSAQATFNTSYNTFNGQISIADPSGSAGNSPLSISQSGYLWPTIPTLNLANMNNQGVTAVRMSGASAQVWEMGSGGSAVNSSLGTCAASGLWYLGNYTAGTCTLTETVDSSYAHKFMYGVIDGALTPSTSPICPNGTNGAFTTTGCAGGGSSTTLQTNGTANSSTTLLNETNSTANAAGFSVTASNPSGGVVVHEVGVSSAATARSSLGLGTVATLNKAGTGAGATTGPTTTTANDCVKFADTAGTLADAGAACGSGGGSGLSGMTTGQIPVAATATTVTSSLPIVGGSGAVVGADAFGNVSLTSGSVTTNLVVVGGTIFTATQIYKCSGGTFNGFLAYSSGACTGGTATATNLYVQ